MVGNPRTDGVGVRVCSPRALALVAVLATLAMMAIVAADAGAEGTKDITLYLHNTSVSKDIGDVVTFRVMNTTQGTDGLATTEPTILATHQDWYLYPALAEEVTVQGRVSMYIWSLRTVRMGDSTQATMIYELYDIDQTGAKVARIARGITNVDMPNYWKQYTVTNASVTNYTVPKGHYLLVEYELQGSSSNWYQIAWGDLNYRSKIVLECQDYLMVDRVDVLDQDGKSAFVLSMDVDGKDVTIVADVTDPFGGYDVRDANVTLEGPDGRLYLTDLGMVQTSGYFTSYVTSFALAWNYSGHPPGLYNLTVTSFDNSGYFYRFPAHPDDLTYGGHLESLTIQFWVGGPPHNVTVTVLDNLTRPLEGAVVTLFDRVSVTDGEGNASIWISNATYDLRVHWQDVLVYEGTVNVSGDTNVTVSVAVFDPQFHVVDDAGDPVDNAVALVEHPNGTALAEFGRTDVSGDFTLVHMPVGDYHITLFWLGAVVFDEPIWIEGNGPFNLSAYVYTLEVRVEDDLGDGLGLAQVVIVESVTGIVLDSSMTGMDGNMSTRLPLGRYDFTVYWRNSLVHDSTKDHLLNASGSIVLLADIFTLNISVLDTAGMPLAGAKVVVGSADGSQVLDLGIVDGSGMTSTRLPPGEYTLWTYWRDILVDLTSPYVVGSHHDLDIVADVHWVPVVVQDSAGEPLEAASVSIEHSSGQPFGTHVTDAGGALTVRLPAGTYGVLVTWSDVPVLATSADIDSNATLVLEARVYYLDVHVVDATGLDLEDAPVTAIVDLTGRMAGEERTDGDGLVTFRLPAGTTILDVTWQGSPVHSSVFELEASGGITLEAAVFHATFRAIDSRDVALSGAIVSVANASTGRPMGTMATETDGRTVLRLPLGEYDLTVSWRDHQVYGGLVVVASNDEHTLDCSVHYLTLHVVDADGIDLDHATVDVAALAGGGPMGTSVTEASGATTFRLPAGSFHVDITWHGVTVLMTTVTVTADATEQLDATVHNPVVHLVDSGGVDLANAEVVVALGGHGTVLATGTTGPDGTVLLRLPRFEYSVTARWQDTAVLDTDLLVDGNGPYTLTASVHHLVFRVADDADVDLAGASVTVTNGTTGLVIGWGSTDGSGETTLRLPEGPADIEVVWRSVLVHADSGIELVEGAVFDIKASVHYLSVRVVGSDGANVAGVDVNVEIGGAAIASGRTDAGGLAEFRLPAAAYTVRIALSTTQHMTPIDLERSEDINLNGTTTLRFDLTSDEYPIPVYRTNLFLVVLLFVVTVVVLLLLMRTLLARERARALPLSEDEGTAGTVDLLDLELEDGSVEDGFREPLEGLTGEAEIELEERE